LPLPPVFTEKGDAIKIISAREATPKERSIMKHTIRLLEDDDYDLADDIAPEYDFAELHRRAKEEGREYRGLLLRNRIVQLDPDVAEFFKTSEAVNEALRRLMREMQQS
jgi:hypothetical protein